MAILFKLFLCVSWYGSASAVLQRCPALSDENVMSPHELFCHADHALETGDMGTARRRIDKLGRRTVHDVDLHRLHFLHFRLALAVGDMDDARRLLRALEQCAQRLRDPEHTVWTRIAALWVAMAEGAIGVRATRSGP